MTLTPLKPPCDPKIIQQLEHWLEEAKAGEYVCIAIAGIRPGGSASTEFTGMQRFAILGALQHLTHRILEDLQHDD